MGTNQGPGAQYFMFMPQDSARPSPPVVTQPENNKIIPAITKNVINLVIGFPLQAY